MREDPVIQQPVPGALLTIPRGHGRRSPKQRRRAGRNVIFVLIAVLATLGVVSTAFVLNLSNNVNSETNKISSAFPDESLRPSKFAQQATNILVLGSDARGSSTAKKGMANASEQRSDSMMLVHVPKDRRNDYVIAITPHTWVNIPRHKSAKINTAMISGGVPLVVQTIEDLLENRIDHVIMADFEAFKHITNEVGRVELDAPVPFSSKSTGIEFVAGPQKLDGDQALAFVREAGAFTDGGYQRVIN